MISLPKCTLMQRIMRAYWAPVAFTSRMIDLGVGTFLKFLFQGILFDLYFSSAFSVVDSLSVYTDWCCVFVTRCTRCYIVWSCNREMRTLVLWTERVLYLSTCSYSRQFPVSHLSSFLSLILMVSLPQTLSYVCWMTSRSYEYWCSF